MGDFYDGYYEATEGDDVVVHLAYSEPEPSLLRVASKKGSSRPQLKVPGKIKRSSFRTSASSRSFKNRLDADQSVYSGGDKTHPLLPDDRDDIYEAQIQRVNIQDQRQSTSGSIVFKATRDGTKSIDSSLSSPSAKAVDLSTKASDTSFDLFANLLIEHLTPKVKNRFYILEEDDITYIDAILPNILRLSFVNAVTVRMSKIDSRLPERDLSSLEKNVLGVYRLGLGKSKQDNFLLGGGQKLHGGKIKMNLIDHDDFVQDDRDTNDLTDMEMSELIKSLDDLKDEELAWLKDSGLSREQSFILENAMALRRTAPSMKTKGSNMQLAEPRDSEANVTKSIREIPCDQFNDIDMIVNPISSYREGENEWKDGMLSIFAHGVFHPFLILTWCAPIYAMAQIMTRLKLNWIGNPVSSENETSDIYKKLNSVVTHWAVASLASLSWLIFSYIKTGFPNVVSVFILIMVNLFMHAFTAFITGNTRIHLREICDIYGDYGEDYIVSVFCLRFVIAQMGRHTGDYSKNKAYIWSATGLSDGWDLTQLETNYANNTNSSKRYTV